MPKNYRRALIIFAIFLLYITFHFAQNYVYYLDRQSELKTLEQEVVELQETRFEYKEKLEFARSLEYVEKVAREQLGLVKEGETLIVVIEEE